MSTKISTLFLFAVLVFGMASYPNSLNPISFDESSNVPLAAFADSHDITDDEFDEEIDDEFELHGILTDNGDGTFDLDTGDEIFTILTDDDTLIDEDLTLGELDGLEVEVEGIETEDGMLATEIEFDDDERTDDDDKKKTKQEKLAEKQAKKEAKLAEKLDKKQEKQDKKEAKLAEKQAKKEAKLAEKQARAAEKLAEKEAKLSEKAKFSEERAQKLIEKLEKQIQKLNERLEKLIDKYQSGKYFGNLKNKDTIIKSFALFFEGAASEISDSSNIESFTGVLYLENQVTGNNAKKLVSILTEATN